MKEKITVFSSEMPLHGQEACPARHPPHGTPKSEIQARGMDGVVVPWRVPTEGRVLITNPKNFRGKGSALKTRAVQGDAAERLPAFISLEGASPVQTHVLLIKSTAMCLRRHDKPLLGTHLCG